MKELKALEDLIHQFNPEVKVAISTAFSQGGQGATELAQHVIDACNTPVEFCPLYNKEQSLLEKLMAVCEAGYGATNIEMTPIATEQLKHFEQLGFNNLAVCIAKTPLSITTDSAVKGAPTGFTVPIRELRLCAGAGFVYALSATVMTMPGLPDKPAFMNLDLDDEGNIVGLS
ncbi:hypothetical protein HLBS07_45740 [Vibrio alginolyticus]|nr:hypothetical protein HLBS07_45740 [Vibrio alginolyticus]